MITTLTKLGAQARASGYIYYRDQILPVRYAAIEASASGDNQIVAAVAGYEIVVLAWSVTSNGAVNARWRSNTTSISGRTFMPEAGRGKVANDNPHGWFKTVAGEALNLNLSAAVAVEGELVYVLFPAP